jgi:pyruvate/2-oxoacid:ferredoxin oxidoreductase alpha subunit
LPGSIEVAMKLRMPFVVFFVSLLLSMTGAAELYAQKAQSVKKQQKEFFKKEEERKKAEAKAQEEGLKHHMEMQDKATKKRMKKSRKRSERIAANKREPFWKRWFIKKPK